MSTLNWAISLLQIPAPSQKTAEISVAQDLNAKVFAQTKPEKGSFSAFGRGTVATPTRIPSQPGEKKDKL